MTSLILSVGEKVLILFLMIGAGVILTRKNILTKAGASQLRVPPGWSRSQ